MYQNRHVCKKAVTDYSSYYSVNKARQDLAVLRYMLHRLSMILHTLEQPDGTQFPVLYFLKEPHGRKHRIAICQPEQLLERSDLHFVGFISGRQKHIEQDIIDKIARTDNLLLAELIHIPGMLSYSSLALRADRWYNLVLLSNPGVKECFHTMETHSYAAYQLAPSYYSWIRLHHGMIDDGLEGQTMRLLGTRYFSFSPQSVSADEQLMYGC